MVVGIRDAVLSERLQMDENVDLYKTVNLVGQSEVVKQQQATVRGESEPDSNTISTIKAPARNNFKPSKGKARPPRPQYKQHLGMKATGRPQNGSQ